MKLMEKMRARPDKSMISSKILLTIFSQCNEKKNAFCNSYSCIMYGKLDDVRTYQVGAY